MSILRRCGVGVHSGYSFIILIIWLQIEYRKEIGFVKTGDCMHYIAKKVDRGSIPSTITYGGRPNCQVGADYIGEKNLSQKCSDMRVIENIKFQTIWKISFDLFSVKRVKYGSNVVHLIVGIRTGVIFDHFLAM